ncbi:MAG: chromosome segregation protein SMC, partial [Actinomycetota bacterium]|nr:chromosome segregation protein SMC [Actinomycetota bacterium]
MPATSEAGRHIHTAAEAVVSALSSVFVLDPLPHAMRGYVPARDVELRRGAENLSAAVASLTADQRAKERLLALLGELSEPPVEDLAFARSDLGDVMLTLRERIGGRAYT